MNRLKHCTKEKTKAEKKRKRYLIGILINLTKNILRFEMVKDMCWPDKVYFIINFFFCARAGLYFSAYLTCNRTFLVFKIDSLKSIIFSRMRSGVAKGSCFV